MMTLIASAGAAHAALSIDYTIGGSGSISYDPTVNNYLSGSGIGVTSVTGNDTPLNPGSTLPISNGVMSFQTGALTGTTGGNTWNFGSGGTITLQGGFSANNTNYPAATDLITGTFISASVTELQVGEYQFNFVGASLAGADNPNLYQYFGIPAGYVSSNALNLSFIAESNTGGGFSSLNIYNGTVADAPTPASSSTPIPAAVYLFGSGLMGLVGMRRKMMN